MLLQIDASHHDWLQGRGPRPVLLAVIDDATGNVPAARFHHTEDGRGYFLLMRDLCRKTGVPMAIYSWQPLADPLSGWFNPCLMVMPWIS